jgi:aspartate kinase
MKVLKFGGTSMGSTDALQKVASILQENYDNGQQVVVVCSAMSGITNQLISMGNLAEQDRLQEAMKLFVVIKEKHFSTAKELNVEDSFETKSTTLFQELEKLIQGIGLIHELSSRSIAYLLSFGERLSTRLLVCHLHNTGLYANQFDSTFIKTEGINYEEDEINWEATKLLVNETLRGNIQRNIISVVTGFFGTNQQGYISLLGRGGSDFSGAILAVSLGINTLEIWTDVDGFLSADPRIVEDAQIIDEIGFQEASELCFFGAKVLHPKTIRPVIDNGGQVWIKNTFNSSQKGTKIVQHGREDHREVISISSKKVGLVSLDLFATQGKKKKILSELFNWAQDREIDIDMIAASEAEISFCIEERYLSMDDFSETLELICPFYIKENRSVVCIVSPKEVKGQIGVAGKIFFAIAESGVSIDMYSQNASEIAQLIVIQSNEVKKVIQNIHEKLVAGNILLAEKVLQNS